MVAGHASAERWVAGHWHGCVLASEGARFPCDPLAIPLWCTGDPLVIPLWSGSCFYMHLSAQPGSRLDDSQKWTAEVMGGFYWVDSWLADTPNHYSLSLTAPLPSGQNVFVPGATCKDACRGWPPQATDWIVGAFWCLLALEPPAAVWSIEKKKNLKRIWRDSFTTPI